MLGEVIGVVELPGAPVDLQLLLEFSVAEPVEAHVHRLGSFWLNLVVDDCLGR